MVIFNLSSLKAAYSSIRPSLIPGEEFRGYRELYNVLIALHDHREPRRLCKYLPDPLWRKLIAQFHRSCKQAGAIDISEAKRNRAVKYIHGGGKE